MSRLDSFIRRLTAQRDILDHLTRDIAALEGPILELGLGNGRTFGHLRERFPGRRIIAFDRAANASAHSMPAPEDLVLGEIQQTAQAFLGVDAALAHADIGTGYPDRDEITLRWLPQLMAGVLRSGGVAASGLPLVHAELQPFPLPDGIHEDRYFIYRRR
ncbi:class I SAM-dependent methyltransferase [Rhizobium tumorigenes]|uniref:class I SAM-dependent methyltransferase n=1 Tax=Rhizobium tumorigenes TaxID=2041385 RepID=UPI00241F4BAD|nr:class I SAM-dependent methyltransferase [Rhizobium tumorigenes]WFS01032.1 class I SAM-dependent methyltransferase [Rhizobium tumorigenes]